MLVLGATDGVGFELVFDTAGGAALDAIFAAVRRFGHAVSRPGRGTHASAPLSFRAATCSGVFTLLPLLMGKGMKDHGDNLAQATRLADSGRLLPMVAGSPLLFPTKETCRAIDEQASVSDACDRSRQTSMRGKCGMTADKAISYGSTSPAVASFGHLRVSNLAIADIVARLKDAIVADGLWVLHEIDPQAILARLDHLIAPARQLLFFHPDLMVRLLQADPAALLEVPLKFAVMALPDGTASVRWIDPATAFARYRNPALATLGQELALACERIATQALRTSAVEEAAGHDNDKS